MLILSYLKSIKIVKIQNMRQLASFFLCFLTTLLVLLTQYCAGDKIEKNEMGWACGTYG